MSNGRWHLLSSAEADRSRHCIQELETVSWARALLTAIESNGGVTSLDARPLLFELRFASEVHNRNIVPVYEFPSGIEGDHVDFQLPTTPGWLIELVSIDETANLTEMTRQEQLVPGSSNDARFLEIRSDADDPRHTGAWQLIKLQEKIFAKVFKRARSGKAGRAHKFPPALSDKIHALLIDTRGFNGGSRADIYDLLQLVYGPKYAHPVFQEHFNDEPVAGLFDEEVISEESNALKERIHCLIFVNEESYALGDMWQKAFCFWNPFIDVDFDLVSKTFPFPLLHKRRLPGRKDA